MAKNLQVGINGSAKQVKNWYVGVDGVARKIKAGYMGVAEVAKQFWIIEDKDRIPTLTALDMITGSQTGSNVQAGWTDDYAMFASSKMAFDDNLIEHNFEQSFTLAYKAIASINNHVIMAQQYTPVNLLHYYDNNLEEIGTCSDITDVYSDVIGSYTVQNGLSGKDYALIGGAQVCGILFSIDKNIVITGYTETLYTALYGSHTCANDNGYFIAGGRSEASSTPRPTVNANYIDNNLICFEADDLSTKSSANTPLATAQDDYYIIPQDKGIDIYDSNLQRTSLSSDYIRSGSECGTINNLSVFVAGNTYGSTSCTNYVTTMDKNLLITYTGNILYTGYNLAVSHVNNKLLFSGMKRSTESSTNYTSSKYVFPFIIK